MRIVKVSSLPGYRLQLTFNDGASGEVDLSDLVGQGVFVAWRDESFFSQVAIDRETGTVSWPGGIDLCPDSLYEEITGIAAIDSSGSHPRSA